MSKLKIDPKIDINEIWKRVLDKTGRKSLASIASELGLSAQAINNSAARNSISLPVLMNAARMAGTSLDYLLYGGEEGDHLCDGNDSLAIAVIGSKDKIKFPRKLLPGSASFKPMALIQGDRLFIINTADKVFTDGRWALGNLERPVIRACKLQIDGRVLIDGAPEPASAEEVIEHIVGRVVWHGEAD